MPVMHVHYILTEAELFNLFIKEFTDGTLFRLANQHIQWLFRNQKKERILSDIIVTFIDFSVENFTYSLSLTFVTLISVLLGLVQTVRSIGSKRALNILSPIKRHLIDERFCSVLISMETTIHSVVVAQS